MSEALWKEVSSALWAVTLLIGGITVRLFLEKIKKLEKIVDDQALEIQAVRGNYLTRFEEVNRNIYGVKDAIIAEVHKVQLHCAAHFIQQDKP